MENNNMFIKNKNKYFGILLFAPLFILIGCNHSLIRTNNVYYSKVSSGFLNEKNKVLYLKTDTSFIYKNYYGEGIGGISTVGGLYTIKNKELLLYPNKDLMFQEPLTKEDTLIGIIMSKDEIIVGGDTLKKRKIKKIGYWKGYPNYYK